MTRLRPGDGVEIVIEALGGGGDGLATLDSERLFLPLSRPGERWRARVLSVDREGVRLAPIERLAGPPLVPPPCPHFGGCGGCALQHLPDADYLAFKLARISTALARAGIGPVPLLPTARSPLGSRRRLRLLWARRGRRVELGYRRRRSRTIEPITVCPIARPELARELPPLTRLLSRLPAAGAGGELSLQLTAAGVDLVLGMAAHPDLGTLEALSGHAAARDLAGLTVAVDGELLPVAVRRPPHVHFGAMPVPVPAGAFLQATVEGEAALQAGVADGLAGATAVLDLFAGLGALTLPLALGLRRLDLVEAQPSSVQAVTGAIRAAGAHHVTAATRDLERAPLMGAELAAFDAVVLDPPRAGAAAQTAAIGASSLCRVVYASCNPASFARDAALLAAAGFTIATLRPVDQFLFSTEIELVALLTRSASPARPAA